VEGPEKREEERTGDNRKRIKIAGGRWMSKLEEGA